jgi:hypothetical protein
MQKYKRVTITRDQLPLPGYYVANIKCRGFKQVKQFDLVDGLSYCFAPPQLTVIQNLEQMNIPVSNDTDLLLRFRQTNNNDGIDNNTNDNQANTTTAEPTTTTESE